MISPVRSVEPPSTITPSTGRIVWALTEAIVASKCSSSSRTGVTITYRVISIARPRATGQLPDIRAGHPATWQRRSTLEVSGRDSLARSTLAWAPWQETHSVQQPSGLPGYRLLQIFRGQTHTRSKHPLLWHGRVRKRRTGSGQQFAGRAHAWKLASPTRYPQP